MKATDAFSEVEWFGRTSHCGACTATAKPTRSRGQGGTFLCWLHEGHDGWHVNPHFRAGQRPAGWFVNRDGGGGNQ